MLDGRKSECCRVNSMRSGFVINFLATKKKHGAFSKIYLNLWLGKSNALRCDVAMNVTTSSKNNQVKYNLYKIYRVND